MDSTSTLPATTKDTQLVPAIESGICHVIFAYDIGFAIDLDKAERLIQHATQRDSIRRTRKAPQYFQYHPPPLRVNVERAPLKISGFASDALVDLVIYDFGAVSVIYRIPFSGPLESVKQLGFALYDNASLLQESGRETQLLLDAIRPAVSKPNRHDLVEDYVVYHVRGLDPSREPQAVVGAHCVEVAQLLRAESDLLSSQEVDDCLTHRISFGRGDLTIIDWNAALMLGEEMDDVLAVLEFANVELLEMRFLDDQLDRAQAQAYAYFAKRRSVGKWRPRSGSAAMADVARLQLDSAFLFESVNNTLKLLGDPYLARVYRLASQRFHLAEWDASILRKLGAIESIYSKISDQQSAWRMEILEWIIILLIAIFILISFK